MSSHNIGFYEDLTKIIFQLSSNTHLISSSESSKYQVTLNVCCNTLKFKLRCLSIENFVQKVQIDW